MAGACPLFAEWQASTANDLDAFHTDLPLEVLLDVSSCTIHFSCTIYQPSCLLFISRDSSPTASSALSLAQLGHKTFSRGCLFAHVDIIQGLATVEASHWYDSSNSRIDVLDFLEFWFLTPRVLAFICKNVAFVFAEYAKAFPDGPTATPVEHSRKPSTDSHRCLSCRPAHPCPPGMFFFRLMNDKYSLLCRVCTITLSRAHRSTMNLSNSRELVNRVYGATNRLNSHQHQHIPPFLLSTCQSSSRRP